METGSARAIERYQEARTYIKTLGAAHPDDLTLQSDWAFCTVNLGLLNRSIDRNDDAGKYYKDALTIIASCWPPIPTIATSRIRMARTYKSLASLQRAQSNIPRQSSP